MKSRIHFTRMFAYAFASCIGLSFGFSSQAQAFCGFYVSPTDEPLYNDASMVALMREGTRTVISMSNNYKGPAKDFAMVVPVPVVLQKENVKTLPRDLFKKLEQLSAPRLVEYWERDPCAPETIWGSLSLGAMSEYGVKVEAKFAVGEYDVVVLGAEQSDGLERWLRENKYSIPKGASAALAPYIKEQQKFFVAKVNVQKVQMNAEGVAVLSPLRFHYEDASFRLPVRLGLLNAQGQQDLIIYVLAKQKRYEVANYTNVFIPTNLDVKDATRNAFGSFYTTLFDAAMYKAGGRAVVTEYAWDSNSCDPCPMPPLEDLDLVTLGGDVLFNTDSAVVEPKKNSSSSKSSSRFDGRVLSLSAQGFVLTRLHTRYDARTLNEDLVFKVADPIGGGREFTVGDTNELEKGVQKDSTNNFQARYVIRHEWTGPIKCDKPRRGVWDESPPEPSESKPTSQIATELASAPRASIKLMSHITRGLDDVASWDQAAQRAQAVPSMSLSPESGVTVAPVAPKRTCGCKFVGASAASSFEAIAGFLGLSIIWVRRKRRF